MNWRALRWRFGGVSAIGTTSTDHQGVPSGTSILDNEVWRWFVRVHRSSYFGEKKDGLYPKNGRIE